MQGADPAPARAAAADLRQRAAQADTVVTATTSFLRELRGDAAGAQATLLDQAHTALTDLQSSAQMVEAGTGPDNQVAAAKMVQTVASVDALLGQLQTVDPAVLVAPFTGEAEVAVAKPVGITDFYAPGAIVLLIQHLGVTFGALSFVRDRGLGLFEMLRVGPVTTAQTLLGKYGAYGIIGAVVAAALTVLVVRGLHVPLAGQVGWVAAVLGLVLVASLGLGFFISLLAKSDSQAVQFAMIVLLASLFFGGFFLSLNQLSFPVELISFVLPVRYGISALQDVMLTPRGAAALRRRPRRPHHDRRARLQLGVVPPAGAAACVWCSAVLPAARLRRPLGWALLVAACIVGLASLIGTVVVWVTLGDASVPVGTPSSWRTRPWLRSTTAWRRPRTSSAACDPASGPLPAASPTSPTWSVRAMRRSGSSSNLSTPCPPRCRASPGR